MGSYMVNWNPERFAWEELANDIASTQRGDPPVFRWSTGTRRSMPVGSRIYLLRQGREPRGFVGSGWSVGPIEAGDHWDSQRDDDAHFVPWVPDVLLDVREHRPLDPRAFEPPLAGGPWTPQASGTVVPANLEIKLEQAWQEHVGLGGLGLPTRAVAGAEGQRVLRLTLGRRRERALREAKLFAAISAHPAGRLICEVPRCGFDFQRVYSAEGAGFAEVHHVVPLAANEGISTTTLADLVVVCANCHAMMHRGGGCRDWRQLIPVDGA